MAPTMLDGVAALLLPLGPDRANQISLAGWIVSHARYEHMASEWQGIAYRLTPPVFQRAIDPAHRSEARSPHARNARWT